MKNCLLLIFVIAVSFVSSSGQSTLSAINDLAKGIDGYVATKKNSNLVFADTSDYTDESKPSWRKFASEKALEKYRADRETYSIAYVWMRGGKPVKANFTLSSPSGDWAKYVYHYFRDDGTLAKAEVDYRTFHGDFIVEQNLYYSPTGKLLKKTTTYKNLQSGKPVTPEDHYLVDNSELLAGDIYKRVRKLPFHRLIKK